MKMDLNQITLPSSNIRESVAFYKRMGFKQIVDTEGYARFEATSGDATFSLHTVESVAKPHGVIIYFEVGSVDETVTSLKQLGFSFDKMPTEQPWLWTEAYLRDPDDNVVCIYHAGVNRKNPPWRIE